MVCYTYTCISSAYSDETQILLTNFDISGQGFFCEVYCMCFSQLDSTLADHQNS
jgi:hypothetical protein